MLPMLLASCSDDLERYILNSPEDTMHLTANANKVQLQQDLGADTAIVFSWKDAANRGEGTKLTYYFKLDVADNNFETCIDKVTIPAGKHSIGFTHKELNALLSSWNIAPGETATLEAEIIANVSGGKEYMKPEISRFRFDAVGYYLAPRDLYIVGTSTGGMDAAHAVKMVEKVSEKTYTWSGTLEAGNYKFVKDLANIDNGYTQGDAAGKLKYTKQGEPEQLFTASQTGFYVITLDIEDLTIKVERPTTDYTELYMVGDATPIGWNIGNAIKLKRDPKNQVAFVYEGPLKAGELKFPLTNTKGFECDYIMAENANASITETKAVRRNFPDVNGNLDTKWKLYNSDAGNYKVTVNTYDMTVTFERDEASRVPDDLAIKALWIVGNATQGGWGTPFSQSFIYDGKAGKGTFVWTGTLQEGEFKLPLDNTNGFDCDYIMPKAVDGNNLAPLSETNCEVIVKGNPDKKWKVEAAQAGTYKISVNVLTNKIKFEKQ